MSSWCLVKMSLCSTRVDYKFLLEGKFHFGTYHFFGEAAFFVGSIFSGSKSWRTLLKYLHWISVCSSSFPVRRVSAMWRDDLWTVGGCEFFLETFFEWSKTPVTMLRTLFDHYFDYYGCFLLISCWTVFRPSVDILMKI